MLLFRKKKSGPAAPKIDRRELLWQPTRTELVTTRFMRNRVLFETLAHVIVPLLRGKKSGGPLHILFAACSTGCEPYTFRFLLGPETHDHFLAVDLDEEAITSAKNAVYGPETWTNFEEGESLFTPPELAKWFEEPGATGAREVAPAFRDIQFFSADLFQPNPQLPPHSFDLVVCNNLLLHFQADWALKAVDILHGLLNPNGVLVIGGCNPTVRAEATKKLNLQPYLPNLANINSSWRSVYRSWERQPRPAWAYPEPDPADPDYAHLCGQIFFQRGALPGDS